MFDIFTKNDIIYDITKKEGADIFFMNISEKRL